MLPVLVSGQMIFDTLDLRAVEILSVRFDRNAGYKTIAVDSVTLESQSSGSLADLLTVSAPVFIKSYGPGSLATSSIRGASAAHTQVFWNGMNINSPMPGQADFSGIPVFVIDKAEIYLGAGSVVQTSGGLGGSIDLSTVANWQNKLKVNIQQDVLSFNTWKLRGAVHAGNDAFQSSTRIYFGSSHNDFPYLNNAVSRENPPTELRKNAAWMQRGALQQFYWKPGGQTILSAKVWLQENHREIPANIMVQVPEGNEELEERFVRTVVRMQHFRESGSISVQTGFMNDYLNYTNVISGIDSKNFVNASLNKIKYDYHGINNLLLTAGAGFDYYSVKSNNYDTDRFRSLGTASVGASYTPFPRLGVNMLLRQEMIDGEMAPLTPSAGASYQLLRNEKLFVKANAARNFHAPSLNDLYWTPGGNPDLDYETGYSYEGGFGYEKEVSGITFMLNATCFYSDIDNWILWQPDSVFSYWTPANLKNVVSQGLETDLSVHGKTGSLTWKYVIRHTYTSAKNKDVSGEFNLSEGKQLIYVPEHILVQNVYLNFSGFSLGYDFNHTGRRYTTTDNSRYLPGFAIHDLSLSKKFTAGQSVFSLRFAVNNLTGKNYQVVAWQPMPGRNFELSVRYLFNKP